MVLATGHARRCNIEIIQWPLAKDSREHSGQVLSTTRRHAGASQTNHALCLTWSNDGSLHNVCKGPWTRQQERVRPQHIKHVTRLNARTGVPFTNQGTLGVRIVAMTGAVACNLKLAIFAA